MVVSILNFIFHCICVYVDDAIIINEVIDVYDAIVIDDAFFVDMSLLLMSLCYANVVDDAFVIDVMMQLC